MKTMDGAYSGDSSTLYSTELVSTNNVCTAQNAVDSIGIYANARCCEAETIIVQNVMQFNQVQVMMMYQV